MESSLDASVHGDINRSFNFDPIKIHIHSIAYAHPAHHPTGYYTITYKFELNEKGEENWDGEDIEGLDTDIDDFDAGCSEEFDINEEYSTDHVPGGAKWWDDWLDWRISSTVKSTVGEEVKAIDSAEMVDGVHAPDPNDGDDGDDDDDNEGSPIGLNPSDPDQVPYPGDVVEMALVTDAPYSSVYWYVNTPWDSYTEGNLGEQLEIDSGDGTTTEASLSWTAPSGAMHTGDCVITAYIYRSDSTVYEETYTVTVDMTPNCDDCTDGSSDCPNASAH